MSDKTDWHPSPFHATSVDPEWEWWPFLPGTEQTVIMDVSDVEDEGTVINPVNVATELWRVKSRSEIDPTEVTDDHITDPPTVDSLFLKQKVKNLEAGRYYDLIFCWTVNGEKKCRPMPLKCYKPGEPD